VLLGLERGKYPMPKMLWIVYGTPDPIRIRKSVKGDRRTLLVDIQVGCHC
jgi:hypothetical protein